MSNYYFSVRVVIDDLNSPYTVTSAIEKFRKDCSEWIGKNGCMIVSSSSPYFYPMNIVKDLTIKAPSSEFETAFKLSFQTIPTI